MADNAGNEDAVDTAGSSTGGAKDKDTEAKDATTSIVPVGADLAARIDEHFIQRAIRKGRERPDYENDPKYEWFRSQPNKLGFARFIEVCFVFNILATLVMLVFTSRDNIVYNTVTLVDFINVIAEGVAIWMFTRRVRAVRWFIIALAIFNISIGTAESVWLGRFTWHSQILSSISDIILIVYFARSVRMKCIMVRDLRLDREKISSEKFVINRRCWAFFRNLGIYYCVFSVLGHWMEAAMCQLIILGVVQGEYDPSNTMLWRDWFYPFPMEGLAVVLIAVLLYPLKEWLLKKMPNPIAAYVVSFFANMFTCVCIEFCFGMLWNADYQLWNYSDMPFNFMGQVCLQNALAFGAASSIIAWLVYPLLERWLSNVPRDIMNIVFVAVLVGYGILQCLYLINPPTDVDETANTAIEQVEKEGEEAEPLTDEMRDVYSTFLLDLTPEDREYFLNLLEQDATTRGSTETDASQ